ncbi:MAG: DUF1573 domain-containing protein [Chitinophagaceae bacterium]|nr:MAG: DUF1573 domain-containing protein [Chitinophagaceae bacterium]
MKKVIFLSAFSFVSFATFAQHEGHAHANTPAAVTAAPAIKAVDATTATVVDALAVNAVEHDFGKIPQGKPVTTEFTVTNTGKTAYKLDNVQASCGCTTPVWDRDLLIEPGKSAKITVGYNAASVAPFTKPVTITYNGNQTKVVTIKGEVFATPAASAPANQGVNELKN